MSEVVKAKVLLSARPRWRGPEHKDRDADEVKHDGRHVEHVVGPVAPAGEKSVEVAEDFFRPEIDSAFAGITVGEFDDGDALRPEEKKKRDDPEPDGDAAVGRDGGDDVQVEDGDYEKENEIAASEGADQVGLGGGLGGGGQSLFDGCEQQVPHRAFARFGMTKFILAALHCCTAGTDEGGCPHMPRSNLVRGQHGLTFAFLLRFRERCGDVVEGR